MIPRTLRLVEYFWFYSHFSKHSHCQHFLHSRDISGKDNGFSDFHTKLLPGLPLIRANKTKRELIPTVNSSRRFKKIRQITLFQEMVVESKPPNQIIWSWYHSFPKTMFYVILQYLNLRFRKDNYFLFSIISPCVVSSRWLSAVFEHGASSSPPLPSATHTHTHTHTNTHKQTNKYKHKHIKHLHLYEFVLKDNCWRLKRAAAWAPRQFHETG